MKKKIFLLLAIVAALTLVFVACKDPQTPEETTPVVTDAPTDPADTPTEEPTDPVETPTTPDETPTEKPTEQVTTEEVTTETPTEPVTLPYVEPSAAGVINQAYDTFKVNGNSYFEVDGECHVKLDAIDNAIAFESAKDVQSIGLRGWIGFPQAIVNFGYFVNDGEFVFDDSFTAPTEDAIKIPTNGGEHGSRYEITIPGEALSGGENTIGFVIKLADETVVLLHKTIKVTLPTPIPDITNKFESNVGDYEDGVDIKNTDIGNYFTVEYGAADPHKVEGGNYCFGGINDMYTAADGLYAYTINFTQADATAMMFVRGTKVVHSVDLPAATGSEFPINNYYESDGDGTMGGAGIYAAIYGGNLNIMMKVYNPDNNSHVGNKKYSIPTEGTELTIADNGKTLFFIVDGKLLATIALDGEVSYEKIVDLAEGVTFAKTATVTLATGVTETVEDTLVVATACSDLGIAVRPAAIKFTSLKVVGFSEISIPAMEDVNPPEPEEPETPDEPETPANVVIDLSAVEGNSEFAAAGYTAPILNIGYDKVFNLGEFDLNKYAQIIIEYSYDGDNTRGDGRTAEQCFTDASVAPIIGFTAVNKSFGYANVVNQDAIDAGIKVEMQYTTGSWAGATRTATIEIPENIGYNGVCYLSAFNPWGTEIVVSSITLVPRV